MALGFSWAANVVAAMLKIGPRFLGFHTLTYAEITTHTITYEVISEPQLSYEVVSEHTLTLVSS